MTGVLGFELSRFVYSQNSGVRNPYTRVQLALTFRIWARNSAVLALIFGLPLLADEPPGFSLALAPLLACLPAVVDSVADPAGKKHGNNGGVTITHAVPESCTARTNSNSIFTRIVVFTSKINGGRVRRRRLLNVRGVARRDSTCKAGFLEDRSDLI